jgi:hypothetical protein
MVVAGDTKPGVRRISSRLLYVESDDALDRLVKTDELPDLMEGAKDDAEGVLESGFEKSVGVGVLDSDRDSVRWEELQ